MSSPFQTTAKEVVGKTVKFERSDAEIIIRMLWYCLDEPKVSAQIVYYCNIDRTQLLRFSQHCIVRGLMKIAPSDDGLLYLKTTERGKSILSTAQNVIEGLGIEFAPTDKGKPL